MEMIVPIPLPYVAECALCREAVSITVGELDNYRSTHPNNSEHRDRFLFFHICATVLGEA